MECVDGHKGCFHGCVSKCLKAEILAERNAKLPIREVADPDHWDRRFLAMARMVASWSKDPSTKFGAVIARPDNTVASLGFNGFPRGCSDADEVYADREEKYGRVVHAEVNAILAAREPLHGYTMYIWPGGIGPACDRCSACIIQAGISTVVHEFVPSAEHGSRWDVPIERGLAMFNEADVAVVRVPVGSSE